MGKKQLEITERIRNHIDRSFYLDTEGQFKEALKENSKALYLAQKLIETLQSNAKIFEYNTANSELVLTKRNKPQK